MGPGHKELKRMFSRAWTMASSRLEKKKSRRVEYRIRNNQQRTYVIARTAPFEAVSKSERIIVVSPRRLQSLFFFFFFGTYKPIEE
jgi:hypothetical protein